MIPYHTQKKIKKCGNNYCIVIYFPYLSWKLVKLRYNFREDLAIDFLRNNYGYNLPHN